MNYKEIWLACVKDIESLRKSYFELVSRYVTMNIGLVLAILNLIWIRFTEGITEFRCTNKNKNDTQVLTLKCPQNLFINVQEALYGHNQWNECKFFVGDCTELFNIDTQCCGRNDCSLVIRKIYSTKCSAYVSFFRVIYECETAERSTCSIKGADSIAPEKATNTQNSNVLPPTSPDVVLPTTDSEGVPRDVYIIIGSAATVAFLLAAIVTVIFFLRKYQWQGEKQCILELFVGWFKRHPPDGCENPADSPKKEAPAKDIYQISTVSTTSPKKAGPTNDINQISTVSTTSPKKEAPTEDINQISTISATSSVENSQNHETNEGKLPKQNNQFKHTSLYQMIKQVTNSHPKASNGKMISEKSTGSFDHTTIDVTYSEIIPKSAISVNNNEELCSTDETHRQITNEQHIFTDV